LAVGRSRSMADSFYFCISLYISGSLLESAEKCECAGECAGTDAGGHGCARSAKRRLPGPRQDHEDRCEGRFGRADHEAIPNAMPAMKTEYLVSDKAMLNGLKLGDEVNFTLRYNNGQGIKTK
jgi:Uncharacterized conserved protein